MSTTHPARGARVTLLVFGTAALAGILLAGSWTRPQPQLLLFWSVVAIVAELMWIRLPVGQATISMASCSQIATALVLPRGMAMAITAATGAIVESLALRKPPLRVLFNASQSALAVGLASLAFGLGGRHALFEEIARGRLWPAALAALVYMTVNTGMVSLAVGWSEGIHPLAVWRRNFGRREELTVATALLSLGILLASHYEASGIAGTILVAFPVVLAHQGYRHLAALRWNDDRRDDEARAA